MSFEPSRRVFVKLALVALIVITSFATMPAAAQATCQNPAAVLNYNHFDQNKNNSFPTQDLAPGDEIKLMIEDTCPSAFSYTAIPVPRAPARPTQRRASQLCSVTDITVCIIHEEQYGSYIVEVQQKQGTNTNSIREAVTKKLEPVTLIIPVAHNPWKLDYTSGFSVSELTDPVFAGKTETNATGDEVTRVIRDSQAEDDANLGIAAFTHLTHEKWGTQTRGYLGPSFGLGIDERNEASYFIGLSWLWGDKGALTLGRQWGSVARLPAGLSLNDPVDGVNVLADLPRRVDDEWFFSLSYSFLGGRDRFEKKIANVGTPSGPKTTTTETEDRTEDDEQPAEGNGGQENGGDTGAPENGAGSSMPPQVENLQAERDADKVKLAWDEAAGAEYQVWRGTSCDPVYLIAEVEATEYEDVDVDPTVTYHYKVRAVIDGVSGDASSCIEVKAP